MNEFSKELKLYLSYPSEIDYWYDYADDAEPKEYAKRVLEQIVGSEEENQFLEACKNVYDQALDDFNEKIIDPIIKKIKKLKKDLPEEYSASIPQRMSWISDHIETCLKKKKGTNIGCVGCAFMVEPSQDEDCASQLVAYPRVWFRNRELVGDYMERMRGNMILHNSNVDGVLDRNIVFVDKVSILPDKNPQGVVEEIKKSFVSMYEGLIALSKKNG